MKLKEIYNELIEIAKQAGVRIKRDNGKFNSGSCLVNESQVVLLNKTTPIETISSVLAKSLTDDILNNTYIKPAVREYIEKERETEKQESKYFQLEVEY